jgi:hypothetical protein
MAVDRSRNSLIDLRLCETGVVFELGLADVVQIRAAQRMRGVVQDGAEFVDGLVDV